MAHDKVNYAAHDISYVQVIVPPVEGVDLMGKSCMVKITESGKFFVRGEILKILN